MTSKIFRKGQKTDLNATQRHQHEISREATLSLHEALDHARFARACIGQNRGPDKEEARESYEACITDELGPVLLDVVDEAIGDLDARDVERLAELVLKFVTKKGMGI